MRISWQSTGLAGGFLVFVLLVLFLGMHYGTAFSIVWAALGPVVGILTGAIPSYFFKQQADAATALATRQGERATVYAEHLTPDAATRAQRQLAVRNLL
jgi:hypothetical protein